MYYGSKSIKIIFLICIIIGLLRILVLCILAIYQKKTDKAIKHQVNPKYSVAVIVPAYNEGKVILKTINRLLQIERPEQYQIIAIDDGSKDDTLALLEANYGNNPLVKIISQENMGKASALNNAIVHTEADIIVTLDANYIFATNNHGACFFLF